MDASVIRPLLGAAGLVLFAAAAVQDIGFRLVSNRVPLAIGGVGLCLHVLAGDAPVALLAAAAVFLAAMLCWRRGWLGGADVKLFGAGALLLPPAAICPFLLDTSLVGGLLAGVYWLAGRLVAAPAAARPAGLLPRLARIERRRIRRGGPLPYAVALSAGACLAMAQG